MPVAASIYLDNAATSWPKPDAVVDAIVRYYRQIGAAAGRGSSSRSAAVDHTIERCRLELGRLINARSHQIVFCFNGTDGLNLALNGLISERDHVVTTVVEHNSVLRPLNHLAQKHAVQLDIVSCSNGVVDLTELSRVIRKSTRLCCMSHVSNVTGIIQPISEVAELCRKHKVLLVIDGSQSVGHVSTNFEQLGCDVLVASGHKGLLGPQGTGFLCLSARAADEILPTRLGGTGTHSDSITQPREMPSRLESGNPNAGGIFGLLEGIRFVMERGLTQIERHQRELNEALIERLSAIDNVILYGCQHPHRSGVVSFNIRNQEPQSVAALLDSDFGIQVRSGLHCAPQMHQALGTDKLGGTVRISPGVFNSLADIETVASAVLEISSQLV